MKELKSEMKRSQPAAWETNWFAELRCGGLLPGAGARRSQVKEAIHQKQKKRTLIIHFLNHQYINFKTGQSECYQMFRRQ